MELHAREVPHNENIFSTLGDWWIGEEDRYLWRPIKQDIYITISKMKDRRYFWPILFHEEIEIAWCIKNGVTSAECQKFDTMWEREIKTGLHKPEEEAGFDKRCPYRGGHVWGSRFERLVCWILGINWKKYCQDCEEIFK